MLYWKQRNGLLGKQFELANAIDLITEANSLSLLEYSQYKRIGRDSLSSKLYFKSLDIVRQLDNERIYYDLKQVLDSLKIETLNSKSWNPFKGPSACCNH